MKCSLYIIVEIFYVLEFFSRLLIKWLYPQTLKSPNVWLIFHMKLFSNPSSRFCDTTVAPNMFLGPPQFEETLMIKSKLRQVILSSNFCTVSPYPRGVSFQISIPCYASIHKSMTNVLLKVLLRKVEPVGLLLQRLNWNLSWNLANSFLAAWNAFEAWVMDVLHAEGWSLIDKSGSWSCDTKARFFC